LTSANDGRLFLQFSCRTSKFLDREKKERKIVDFTVCDLFFFAVGSNNTRSHQQETPHPTAAVLLCQLLLPTLIEPTDRQVLKMAVAAAKADVEYSIKPEAVTPAIPTSEWPLLLKNYDKREFLFAVQCLCSLYILYAAYAVHIQFVYLQPRALN
jgi:hypothetical protein